MARKHRTHKTHIKNLEVYAFWTGFASTVISLCQVLLLADK